MTGPTQCHDSPPVMPPAVSTSSSRLLFTLAFFGSLAGAVLAFTYQRTLPPIRKFAAERVDAAVREVLGSPAQLDTLFLVGDKLVDALPAGVDVMVAIKVFIGLNEKGEQVGVAVEEGSPGFSDEVRLLVGFNPLTGALTGFKVLAQKETPGLGDKIVKDSGFVRQFVGKVVNPLKGDKNPTTDPSTVQTITGATITSKAVIKVINKAVETWKPRLEAYAKGGGQ